jgi:hypothetical protein
METVLVRVLLVVSVAVVATIAGIMSGTILANVEGRDEFLKFLFSVLQLALVGGVLWAAQEKYKHARSMADAARSEHENKLRARSEARRSYLEDTAHRLRLAYADVKRRRRILKARVGTAPKATDVFDLQGLYTHGEALMQSQLELEGLKWETIGAARPGGLIEGAAEIPENLRRMEEYANGLSKALMRFTNPPKQEYLERLLDCVGSYEGSKFAAQFGKPYDVLTEGLMRARAS